MIARLDLACPDLQLGVEANSKEFHFGQRPESMDQRRDNRCSALGWHISYVGWYDTEKPATVAKTIEAIARRRATQLGVTSGRRLTEVPTDRLTLVVAVGTSLGVGC